MAVGEVEPSNDAAGIGRLFELLGEQPLTYQDEHRGSLP
jgi:hypothetical protein